MYDCPGEVLNDLAGIQEALAQAAKLAKSTLLSQTAHRFEPQGVTALCLLAESHISVHTWPELGYAAADVFTCGDQCLPEMACAHLAKALQSGRHELRQLQRGTALLPTSKRSPATGPGSSVTASTEPHSDEANAG